MAPTSPGRVAPDSSMRPRDRPAADGSRLLAGRYEVGDLLGRGGMADVHVGTDTRLNRKVAIKLLKPSLATDPRFRRLFREEAQKAARMAHPTIVRVFDAGEETVTGTDGAVHQLPYIVMEYVDGRLLKDVISDGPLDPKEAVRIIAQVLTALEYSHRALLVHRDIKPGNIMITQNGRVKVMDFGIARAVSDNSATVAETGAVLGTAQYFSPEQAKGETVDARTDLYSTGVILFELLTGRAPFRGERAAAVAYQHISEAAVAPSSINPQVPPALDAVVLHALIKSKLERFQTAAEFRADVEAAADGEVPAKRGPAVDFTATLFGEDPGTASAPDTALRQLSPDEDERIVRTQSRPPVAWIWAAVALMAAILIAVVIWVVNLPSTESSLADDLSVQVPDVVGAASTDAQARLTELELTVTELTERNDTVPEGSVIRTDPTARQQVAPGQAVRMYVSLGPEPVDVPRLDQSAEADAIDAIEAAGLQYGATTPAYSPNVPVGTVVSSTPASGEQVTAGSTVDLVVSNGQIELISVIGQPVATATSLLTDLQLTVNPVQDPGCSGGNVTAQSLPAGPQPQQSEVSLTYCAGP